MAAEKGKHYRSGCSHGVIVFLQGKSSCAASPLLLIYVKHPMPSRPTIVVFFLMGRWLRKAMRMGAESAEMVEFGLPGSAAQCPERIECFHITFLIRPLASRDTRHLRCVCSRLPRHVPGKSHVSLSGNSGVSRPPSARPPVNPISYVSKPFIISPTAEPAVGKAGGNHGEEGREGERKEAVSSDLQHAHRQSNSILGFASQSQTRSGLVQELRTIRRLKAGLTD